MDINSFHPISPETLRNRTDEELAFISAYESPSRPYASWTAAELARRHLIALREVTANVHLEVGRLAASSTKLETLTSTLIQETANVHGQVVVLTTSSHNIERLTKWLIWLTVALGILTLVLAMDVGLKYVPEHLELTAPQTPVHPPR